MQEGPIQATWGYLEVLGEQAKINHNCSSISWSFAESKYDLPFGYVNQGAIGENHE